MLVDLLPNNAGGRIGKKRKECNPVGMKSCFQIDASWPLRRERFWAIAELNQQWKKKRKKTKEPKTIATSGLLFFIGFLVCSTPFHPRLLLTAVPPFRLDGRRCVLPRHRTSKCCKEIQNVIEIMNRRERGVEQCNKSALMPSNSLIPKVYFLSFRLFSRGPSRFFFSTPPPIIHSFFYYSIHFDRLLPSGVKALSLSTYLYRPCLTHEQSTVVRHWAF